jgi:site-specific DNA-methyltransferase (adenine-specific)
MADLKTNVLYFGDNLKVLREHIPPESVDLIYLDPPFNSNADYNVLFREPTGERSAAQLHAFTDTWHWDKSAEQTYQEVITTAPLKVSKAIEALRGFIGSNDVMAYLAMMTVRLVELHRVLKPTGSLYLHCDPSASHYLKVMLDTIFGPQNFRSEIIWRRSNVHNKLRRQYGPIHDTLLFYAKNVEMMKFHPGIRSHYRQYIRGQFTNTDKRGPYRLNELTGSGTRKGESGKPWRNIDVTARGRHWAIPGSLIADLDLEGLSQHQVLDALAESGEIIFSESGFPRYKQRPTQGVPYQDVWAYQPYTERFLQGTEDGVDRDVKWLEDEAERLGYQTQKPLGLLERIISSSSDPGDVVLDPFCGCGTAVVAAQKLDRKWIGIDITHLAITVMKQRLEDSFPGLEYEVVGQPVDVAGARALARQDRYQFQWWALGLVGAQPRGGERKKGADAGIDGVIAFPDDAKGKALRVIVQVKSGGVQAKDIRDLKGVVDDKDLGLFITLAPPTQPMRTAALEAGHHESALWVRRFPRIQIMTVEELLAGKKPDLPQQSGRLPSFARAPRVARAPRTMLMEFGPEYRADGAEARD